MEWMILPFRRYADFSGRSQRMEYWMFVLLNTLVLFGGLIVLFIGGFAIGDLVNPGSAEVPEPMFWTGMGLLGLYCLAIIVPSIAVVARRFHDCNLSGRWYLVLVAVALFLPFVGFAAWIGMIVVMCLPGTRGPNRYGNDPKDPMNASVFA